jgi:hypothetical protein
LLGSYIVGGLELRGPLNSRDLAKANLATTRADVRDLARAKVEAARVMVAERWKDFRAGRGTLDILLEATLQLLEAELAVHGQEAERVAIYGRHWALAQQIEAINKRRYDAGRIAIQDYAQTTHHRLQAEIRLLQTWGGKKPGLPPLLASDPASQVLPDLLSAKELAKAARELGRCTLTQLRQASIDVARQECQARAQEFLAGRGTLDILLGSSRRLLEAELVVCTQKTERVAALERHWERMMMMEVINKGRHDAGRIATKDYMETRYARLEAEIRLIRLRASEKDPGEVLPSAGSGAW